jgi:uncharacterized protein (TIGR00255 family)
LLLSMTGFGDARLQNDRWTIAVELRSVNNRHFKLTSKINETHAMMEPALEQLVRDKVKRGTVQLNVRIDRPRRPEDYRLNLVALASYRDQLRSQRGSEDRAVDLAQLLVLPGVVEEIKTDAEALEPDWPQLAKVASEAIARLEAARAQEGAAMARELLELCRSIELETNLISERAPLVVAIVHKKLHERIQTLLEGSGVTVEPRELAREAAILADRSDISEEIVRFRAHLKQFVAIIGEAESSGRKLEFVAQEMGREINTIGAKAGDVEISRSVVEVKALLEKIRELVQNVE